MRNPERIDKVLNIIEKVWKKAPDLRLMQLIGNCFLCFEQYRMEDDELIKALEAQYSELLIDTNKNIRTRKNIRKTSKT